MDQKPVNLTYKTILVVEDDAQVREILVKCLKSIGFKKIIEASQGEAALKIIRSHREDIDLIISDWEMPKADGLVLLKAVRNDWKYQNVKFIMVTSQRSQEKIKVTKAALAHVDAYIIKPFRLPTLRQKIYDLFGLVVPNIPSDDPESESA